VTYTRGQRRYRRKLGTATAEESPGGYMAGFTGVARERQPSPLVDADPAARIADMDLEGVEVNLTLPSGWFGTWTSGDDVALEMAMYRAYHRWMEDYCGAFRDGSAASSSRARATSPAPSPRSGIAAARHGLGRPRLCPFGVPLDHPDLEPIYAERRHQTSPSCCTPSR